MELKSGETFNGLLIACDNFMNLTLREVYQTSSSGEEFWKLPECYIKGATVSMRGWVGRRVRRWKSEEVHW